MTTKRIDKVTSYEVLDLSTKTSKYQILQAALEFIGEEDIQRLEFVDGRLDIEIDYQVYSVEKGQLLARVVGETKLQIIEE